MNLLVLVVDDEPDVELLFRQQFRHDLRAGRFTMEFARSGDMALQRITGAKDVSPFVFVSERGGSTGWSSGQGKKQTFRFKCMLICFAMPPGTGWRWSRYTIDPGLPRAQEHPAYGAIYRTVANSLQRFLERLSVIDTESSAPMSAFAVAIGGKAMKLRRLIGRCPRAEDGTLAHHQTNAVQCGTVKGL